MKVIGEAAFCGTPIEEISLPELLIEIANGIFGDCAKLKRIKMPSKIKLIDNSTFRSYEALEEIILREGLLGINTTAFEYCSSLKRLHIPSTVKAIGGYAFQYCTALEEINIPGRLTTSLGGLFERCCSLRKIDVEANQIYTSMNNCLVYVSKLYLFRKYYSS